MGGLNRTIVGLKDRAEYARVGLLRHKFESNYSRIESVPQFIMNLDIKQV